MKTGFGSGAFHEMSIASSRELLRNAKTFVGLSAIFVVFLGLVGGLYLVDNLGHPRPIVTVTPDSDRPGLLAALRESGVAIASDDGVSANASIAVDGSVATVQISREDAPRWGAIVQALEKAGWAPVDITVRDEFGSPQRDILRANLSSVLVSGLVAIAFTGTTVPLVAMRRRGTLRLLGTTPVSRLQFVIAQTPVRFALGIVEALIIFGIALSRGYLVMDGIWRLPITLLLGFAMLFAFAFLLASRSSNPELMLQVVGGVPVIVLFGSGTMLPLDSMPTFVTWVSNALPSTWFMQAITADVTGASPILPVGILWALMTAATVAALAACARLFRWNQGAL